MSSAASRRYGSPQSFKGGSAMLNALGERFERAGGRVLEEAVQKALKESLELVEAEIKETAMRILPKKGGLNRWVAEVPIFERSKQMRDHYFGAWVISHKEGHSLVDVDRGRIGHPIFSDERNKSEWVYQTIPAGYFSKTIKKNLPFIKKAIERASLKIIRGE